MFYKLLNAYTRQFSFPHRGLKYFLKTAKWLGIADKTYQKKFPGNFYMYLNPSEHIQQQLFWYGYYEKSLGDLIKKMLRPGDVFLDIGANVGYFSLLAAAIQPRCRIFSFEPVKDLFEKLEQNIFLNQIKNINAVNAATGEVDEERKLFLSGSDNLGMSSFQEPENFSGMKETVKVISIDHWFESSGLSKIDLLKLDVEGSELATLKGMKEVLQNQRPALIVEVNPETLSMFTLKPDDIYDYLNKLNFDGFIVSEFGRLEPIKQIDSNQPVNVLFIHSDKTRSYREMLNQ